MKCSYTITEQETVKAMQLHSRGSVATLIFLCILAFAVIFIAITTKHSFFALCALVGGVIGYFFSLFLVIPFSSKKQYREYRALQRGATLETTEKGITFKTEYGENIVPWSDIHKWRSTGNVLMLYVTSKLFFMIPTRALPSEEEMINLLNENIGPKMV